MSLILNEREWAEDMISRHELGKNPTQTLRKVASYYYESKYSRKEIRRMLETFLVSCDPTASLVKWADSLDRIVKNVDKHKLIQVEGVDVTVPEMLIIQDLPGKQLQRLAFTVLCVSKYWDAVSKDNRHWLNTSDKEVIAMANISTSTKRQSLLFGQLIERKLIKQAKKVDNLNVQILFGTPGDVAIHITDFRNLGYQYLRFCGGGFYECENCGLVVRIPKQAAGPKHKYCPDCAVTVHTKQKVDSVMRTRAIIHQNNIPRS